MPTYDYVCKRCERTFEVFQPITAKPMRTIKTDCAQCNNKAPVIRQIGAGAGVIFKGSGFYQTDYRSKSYEDGAKAAADEVKKSGGAKDGEKSGSSPGEKDKSKTETAKSDTKSDTGSKKTKADS